MRLHSLALRDFRGVKDRIVRFRALGTTVVVGDNEVGKSSLVEAFGLVFDLPDDSKSTRIRDIQPVGQDVGPQVTAELSLGGRELTYSKTWLKNRSTELTIVEPDGRRRYLDVEWRKGTRALAAEVDGALHLVPQRWFDDQLRQNEIVLAGTPLLRFPSVVVRAEEALVVDQLRRGLAALMHQ